MVYKTLHRRLKIEQHKQKTVMNSSTPEGSAVPRCTSDTDRLCCPIMCLYFWVLCCDVHYDFCI